MNTIMRKQANKKKQPHNWTTENVIPIFCLIWGPFSLTIQFQVISEEILSVLRSILLMSTIWKQVWDQKKIYAFESFKI